MNKYFHELFDYNFHCNKRIIEALVKIEEVSEVTNKLFSHILNAHHMWNYRLLKEQSTFGVWQMHQKDDWLDIHFDNQRTTFEIITNIDDFEAVVDYESSEGRSFSNEKKEILFHIINHSTHHRGQILMDLRQNGFIPPSLDYIFYKRIA